MHLLNWASPTPGASEVGLPHVITRPRFHLRPALKLPEQHFHFSAVVCILIIFICSLHRNPTAPLNARSKNAKCKRALDTTLVLAPLHGYLAYLIAQKHRCAASRIVSVRRCRRRRTALASCACASKQCSFSTADRLLWLDQSQRRQRCLQRCACEISASPDSECAVSESRKALHCATILHAHELTSCASSSAGTKPCR